MRLGSLVVSHNPSLHCINEAVSRGWAKETAELIHNKKIPEEPENRSTRTLEADLHSSLVRGGAVMCPPGAELKLLCEALPAAFLVEQAGGAATDGATALLDIVPHSIHDTTPAFFGSKQDVPWRKECFQKDQEQEAIK